MTLWLLIWFIAVSALAWVGFHYAGIRRARALKTSLIDLVFVVVVIAVLVTAMQAMRPYDVHLDMTGAAVFTPAPQAVAVVEGLESKVSITYFGHSEDPDAKRLRLVVEAMARRQPLLDFRFHDPDKEPTLAKNYGVKFYNVAVVETAGRQIIVNSADETEIAIGIQKALRERQTLICFLEGHGEYAIDNEEFHTHIESFDAGHHGHGHAHIGVVQTTPHGIGRLKRSLLGLGYDVLNVNLISGAEKIDDCALVVAAGPQSSYLEPEVDALRRALAARTSLWLLIDLAFAPNEYMQGFLHELGIRFESAVIVDPSQHYGNDQETIAVTSYESHRITENIAMTIFPGVRPISFIDNRTGLNQYALIKTSRKAAAIPLKQETAHVHHEQQAELRDPGEQLIAAAAIEVPVADGKSKSRVIAVGDVDFLSNSFFPYVSNNALALSIVRWLVREDESVPITPRIPALQTIVLTNVQMRVIFIACVLTMPSLVILIGIFVARRRP